MTHNAERLAIEQARTVEPSAVIDAPRARAFRTLAQAITRDGAATCQHLQDQSVAECLRGAVPVVYGCSSPTLKQPTQPSASQVGLCPLVACRQPLAEPPGNPGQRPVVSRFARCRGRLEDVRAQVLACM